jgi:hypothetical protein
VAAVTVLAGVAVACGATVAGTTSSDQAGTTARSAATGDSSKATTASRTGVTKANRNAKNCGSIDGVGGWPTTMAPDPDAVRCLVTAFEAGESATMHERQPTDREGGHVVLTAWEVTGYHKLLVQTDTRDAEFSPNQLTVEECSKVVADGYRPAVSECRQPGVLPD